MWYEIWTWIFLKYFWIFIFVGYILFFFKLKFVRYFLWGLADGQYPTHVHLRGDISDTNLASSVAGHYIGPNGACSGCRNGPLQEVGALGDGYRLNAANSIIDYIIYF